MSAKGISAKSIFLHFTPLPLLIGDRLDDGWRFGANYDYYV